MKLFRNFFVFFLLAASLSAWQTPVRMPTTGVIRDNYVRLNSGNTAYIAYVEDYKVKLAKYDGVKFTYIGQVSDGRRQAYTPTIRFSTDNSVHIVWGEAIVLAHADNSVMYRRFNETTGWSPITELKTYNIYRPHRKGPNHPKIEQLRFDLDKDNNIYIVFYEAPFLRCRLLTRYGEEVMDETWPDPFHVRTQTPDIVLDDTDVHVTWNQFLYNSDGSYSIYYSKRPLGKANRDHWSLPKDIKSGIELNKNVHRPRIALDENKVPYILYMQDTETGSARNMYIRYLAGSSFSGLFDLTHGNTKTYNNLNLEMTSASNMLVIAHGSFNTFYNWRINGVWSGLTLIDSIPPFQDMECASLSRDGSLVVVTYSPIMAGGSVFFEEIWLTANKAWVANELPVPVIHANKDVFYYGDTVLFDGSASTDADGHIVKYEWDFGDGDVASGIQVSHAFIKKAGNVVVKLTVTDDRGAKGFASKAINVLIQPPQPVISFQPDTVYWQDTVAFDGSGSSDPYFTIVKYAWDFGDGATATGDKVSHAFVSRYGDVPVKLTVTNDKDVSASVTRTIKVNALFAANATFEKKRIRTLFHDRFGYVITWSANAKNAQAGYTVVKYRIMRKAAADAGDYAAIGEVDAATTVYRDLGIEQTADKDYLYAVCSVDANGHASPVENF